MSESTNTTTQRVIAGVVLVLIGLVVVWLSAEIVGFVLRHWLAVLVVAVIATVAIVLAIRSGN